MVEVRGSDPEAVDQLGAQMKAAASLLRTIGSSTSVLVEQSPWQGRDSRVFLEDWGLRMRPQLEAAAVSVHAFGSRLVLQAEDQRQASASEIHASANLPPAGIAAVSAALAALVAQPPTAARSVEIRAWAKELSAPQQGALAKQFPEIVGSANGLPAAMRDLANRALMADYVQRLSEQADHSDDENRRIAMLQGFLSTGPANQKWPDAVVLAFDPRNDGLISVALGDPNASANVAVMVPGIGHEMRGFEGMLRDASAIRNSDGETSVIAWLGYDSPGGVVDRDRFVDMFSGVGEQRAARGAVQLRDFMDGLGLSEQQRVSVLGHSYGSVVVMLAAARGGLAMVNNIVTLGSPGSERFNSVEDLRLADGQRFYSLAADRDFISGSFGDLVPGHGRGMDTHGPPLNLPRFVTDAMLTTRLPSDPGFGGTRLETDSWGGASESSQGHSQYYREDTGALRNVQAVVMGTETHRRSIQLDDWFAYRRGIQGEVRERAAAAFHLITGS